MGKRYETKIVHWCRHHCMEIPAKFCKDCGIPNKEIMQGRTGLFRDPQWWQANLLNYTTGEAHIYAIHNSMKDGKRSIETNGRGQQAECISPQRQPEANDKHIDSWPCLFTVTERAWETKNWECLAVVWNMILIRGYLEGSWFKTCTDRKNLNLKLNLADGPARLGWSCHVYQNNLKSTSSTVQVSNSKALTHLRYLLPMGKINLFSTTCCPYSIKRDCKTRGFCKWKDRLTYFLEVQKLPESQHTHKKRGITPTKFLAE